MSAEDGLRSQHSRQFCSSSSIQSSRQHRKPTGKESIIMYDAARVPSPKDGANGVAQPVVPGAGAGAAAGSGVAALTAVSQASNEATQLGMEEEEEDESKAEPVLVKKPHREILDHERKRRVELKCMELQEMMEEQGYTEEEIQQKVSTFRQMLMDKEGVITREGSHTQPVSCVVRVNHLHYQPDEYEDPELAGYEDGDYGHDYHSDSRVKRKSSSSPSPRPKKRKKKKSGRRRSRFGSSSPTRREKKKKSGKKHKRDRSASGSRKKRRYRSGSPKNRHKDKNKQKKRSPGETPGRSSQRQGSCCSSRSASLSSTQSTSKSPSRLNSKHKADGPRAPGTLLSPGPNSPATWHNGDHVQRGRNGKAGRLNHVEGEKGHDKLHLLTAGSASIQSTLLREHKLHSASSRSQTGPMCASGEAGSIDGRNTAVGSSVTQTPRRRGSQRGQNKSSHSPAHSSDSTHSQHKHTHRGRNSRHQRKTKAGHSSKRHHRSSRGQAHHRSASASPGRHSHTSGRKKEESRSKANLRQRSSSWSSGRSSSHSASRDRGPSKAKSPHNRQNNSRERDSPNRSDTDSRARRRSRSYSPIRKRRRDSPSFMEARRITSPKAPDATTTGCC
ncbi:serine/arginine repetitive matrix protein 3 isoform X4 [Scophthalmus maximus]|uniref:serine/arginine repetitive matrix protein 3 isoform X4 n=1 Tax=Scophthalmus maximus TaxID=52904 RepID=UPI001FA89261|nr:serine/arginine repetitive matrix protein 3 isoform X4 [Scophthalmus maximus]